MVKEGDLGGGKATHLENEISLDLTLNPSPSPCKQSCVLSKRAKERDFFYASGQVAGVKVKKFDQGCHGQLGSVSS